MPDLRGGVPWGLSLVEVPSVAHQGFSEEGGHNRGSGVFTPAAGGQGGVGSYTPAANKFLRFSH